jgi:hypothetical protein
MILTIAIYTTNRKGLEKDILAGIPFIKQTIGIEDVKYAIYDVSLNVPEIERGADGGIRLDDQWLLKKVFTQGQPMINCLHISTKERDAWGLIHPKPGTKLGGSYYINKGDKTMDMVIIGEPGRKAIGYPFSTLTKTFIHEVSHAFSHWTGVPDETHDYDYNKKMIDKIFKNYNFTRWKTLKALYEKLVSSKPKNIYESALSFVGKDASPDDLASDELGCAESVTNVIKKVLPDFPIITGTWTLYDRLRKDTRFKKVTTPQVGDIIISPTGSVAKATFPGHVGVVGMGHTIMSNSSATGIFESNYTFESWRARYRNIGGYPIYYFRLI